MSGQKKADVQKYLLKRQSKCRQLAIARSKRWSSGKTNDASLNATANATVSEAGNEEISHSATKYKFRRHKDIQASENSTEVTDDCSTGKSKFLIIDITLLSGLVSSVRCPVCNETGLQIIEGSSYGLASELILKCFSCDSSISSSMSSRKVDNYHSSFKVTKRIVTAMVDIGAGFAGLEKFCAALGMNGLHHKTFNKHSKAVCRSATTVADDTLEMAAKIVRKTYCQTFNSDKDGIIDISVSYDGSWMKRGHTSNFGIGVVIELITGLVLDYQIMSKYCHSCAILSTEFKQSSEYEKWKDSHICDKNFDGSSGSMEVSAALLIWKRSLEKHGFRYITMLSDGDSKTYTKLVEANIYGDDHPITKEECVNHVAKRMGTSLRKVITECHNKGLSIGGRGRGKLMQKAIEKLTLYYQRAIHNNLNDTENMRKAIYATLFHAVSTDSDPHHTFCPTGSDSWCFFNRAVANGAEPGKHDVMVGTPLSKDVAEQLLPIYKRLSEDSLLKRCQRGKTQNSNESLHALIWSKCPKTSFLQRSRVEGGVALAVSQFNRGRQAIAETLADLGIAPGDNTLHKLQRKDQERENVSQKRSVEKFKNIRKAKKLAKIRAEELATEEEGGPSYAPGEF